MAKTGTAAKTGIAAQRSVPDSPTEPVARRPQPRACSIARTLEVVGEKWSLLAMREMFFKVRRFDQIVANTGAPRDILATRLRKLVDAGLVVRVQYNDRPPRFEYHLTEAGRDLQPVLLTLMDWGDKHLAGDKPPPTVWTHTCGEHLTPSLTCESCGQKVRPGALTLADVG